MSRMRSADRQFAAALRQASAHRRQPGCAASEDAVFGGLDGLAHGRKARVRQAQDHVRTQRDSVVGRDDAVLYVAFRLWASI